MEVISHFRFNGSRTGYTLYDFWNWAYSDLLNDSNRGALAEFIVASSLGITKNHRDQWREFDLETTDGTRIEIKSGAYIQTWDIDNPFRISENIRFRIAPSKTIDDNRTYRNDCPSSRKNDTYVFCVYTSKCPEDSPLCLDLWEFYVISTKRLNKKVPHQQTISLASLKRLRPIQCTYAQLPDAIDQVLSGSFDNCIDDNVIGSEHFYANGKELSHSVADYWNWSHSNFHDDKTRSSLADYIVASSLGLTKFPKDKYLLCNGMRVMVKSGAYAQSYNSEHPDYISFKLNSENKADIYVFAIYKSLSMDETALNMDLWDFYILDKHKLKTKNSPGGILTLPSLIESGPLLCSYHGIEEAIKSLNV